MFKKIAQKNEKEKSYQLSRTSGYRIFKKWNSNNPLKNYLLLYRWIYQVFSATFVANLPKQNQF